MSNRLTVYSDWSKIHIACPDWSEELNVGCEWSGKLTAASVEGGLIFQSANSLANLFSSLKIFKL